MESAQPGRRRPVIAGPWLGVAFAMAAIAAMAVRPFPGSLAAAPSPPAKFSLKIEHTYPHDPEAYTQGLIYQDGALYESTGLNGRSSIRKIALETGEVMQQKPVDAQYFAEGLTDWNGQLLQLTWQSQIGFVYDMKTFALRRTFSFTGEGWGLTHDAARLILSDGTDRLRFLDPATLKETGAVRVRDGAQPVPSLNELEFVRGAVLANVWHTDRIARIDPATGLVTAWIDLSGLLPQVYQLQAEAVLNGIAYDATSDRLFVTGKLWPKLFEVRLVPVR
jgi:glutamine cyclotransferase